MLLKRQAFAVFSGELDQYHLYLPLIQGKTPPQPPPRGPPSGCGRMAQRYTWVRSRADGGRTEEMQRQIWNFDFKNQLL